MGSEPTFRVDTSYHGPWWALRARYRNWKWNRLLASGVVFTIPATEETVQVEWAEGWNVKVKRISSGN